MKKSSLTVVGTGIKFLSQMTLEARTYIEKSEKVLFLVNDPALKQWIMNTNINSESLDDIYFGHEMRLDSYSAITNYILEHLLQPKHLCVVLYGHPAVFSKPALDAVIQAQAQGYDAKILPGISAEDCLFADLLIDPGTYGCQSFEATDFLLYHRKFDPNSHLILWQPDVIGIQDHHKLNDKVGIALLSEHLHKFYPQDHEVIVYEAAQYPGLQANIYKTQLNELVTAPLSPICTLYVKPLCKSKYDESYAMRLGLKQ
jgi:tetrapyrrole methylase family protein/MazG family protein